MRMVDKNEQALAMAYRRAVAKSLKIKELEIAYEDLNKSFIRLKKSKQYN